MADGRVPMDKPDESDLQRLIDEAIPVTLRLGPLPPATPMPPPPFEPGLRAAIRRRLARWFNPYGE